MQLFKIEIDRLISEIRNYILDNVISLLDVFLICLGIFLGAGQEFFQEKTLFYALVGMILWRYTVVCLQTACNIIQKEIRLGTLEQLMLAKYSLLELVIIRLLAKLLVETIRMIIISIVLISVFHIQVSFNINIGLILLAIAICLAGTIGIGCLVAGIALVYRKANALVNSVSYFTLFFTGLIVPLEVLSPFFSNIAMLLPFYWCVTVIRQNILGVEFFSLLTLSIFWVVIGKVFFNCAIHRVISNGATSKY